MPELTPEELQTIMRQLEQLCAQAQELQRQIKAKMVEQARRDYPTSDSPGVERRQKRRSGR